MSLSCRATSFHEHTHKSRTFPPSFVSYIIHACSLKTLPAQKYPAISACAGFTKFNKDTVTTHRYIYTSRLHFFHHRVVSTGFCVSTAQWPCLQPGDDFSFCFKGVQLVRSSRCFAFFFGLPFDNNNLSLYIHVETSFFPSPGCKHWLLRLYGVVAVFATR